MEVRKMTFAGVERWDLNPPLRIREEDLVASAAVR